MRAWAVRDLSAFAARFASEGEFHFTGDRGSWPVNGSPIESTGRAYIQTTQKYLHALAEADQRNLDASTASRAVFGMTVCNSSGWGVRLLRVCEAFSAGISVCCGRAQPRWRPGRRRRTL
jgi:hypothetical protein